eukprot:g14442.t1
MFWVRRACAMSRSAAAGRAARAELRGLRGEWTETRGERFELLRADARFEVRRRVTARFEDLPGAMSVASSSRGVEGPEDNSDCASCQAISTPAASTIPDPRPST